MTYCFKCPECGAKTERELLLIGTTFLPYCGEGHEKRRMVRDWQAESANVNVEGLH